jgi:hypothetical protein
MANFFKAAGMSENGFDKILVKQAMASGATAQIALFGGDSDGSALQVKSNNPGVIELAEGAAPSADVRAFKIVGKQAGYTMVEARTRTGAVWAALQVQVGADNSLDPSGRVAEAMRRSIPLLPAEAGNAVQALVSPESLLTITGTLTLWAGAHFFGVGEIADIILLVLGGLFLGKGIIDLADELWQFANLTILGSTDREIDEAAKHFAKAVMLAGVDIISAILLRKGVKYKGVRSTEPGGIVAKGKLVPVAEAPNLPKGQWFGKPKVTKAQTLPGNTLGLCDWYGDIYISRAQSMAEQATTEFHETVHSALSPKFRVFRAFRAGLKASSYWRMALLRFLEEALAESYAMLKTRGFLAAIKAVTFPISNGYVTITQLAAEGTRIGTIMLAGGNYGVFWAPNPPAGMPPAPQAPQ